MNGLFPGHSSKKRDQDSLFSTIRSHLGRDFEKKSMRGFSAQEQGLYDPLDPIKVNIILRALFCDNVIVRLIDPIHIVVGSFQNVPFTVIVVFQKSFVFPVKHSSIGKNNSKIGVIGLFCLISIVEDLAIHDGLSGPPDVQSQRALIIEFDSQTVKQLSNQQFSFRSDPQPEAGLDIESLRIVRVL